MSHLRGFSLLELMIVVSIIAIISVLAIPAYQNYVIRAKVTEGLSLASPAKIAIHEAVASSGTLPSTQADTFYTSPNATDSVSSVQISNDGNGLIIITYTANAGGGTIIMTPNVDAERNVFWTCTAGTLPNRFRPANCR
tara:strand:- start:119 stop:535 length:417 start_codon:yes stop_codon:yes gene_type:complete